MVYYLKCLIQEYMPIVTLESECLITYKTKEDKRNPHPVINGQEWPEKGNEWIIVAREKIRDYQGEKIVRLENLDAMDKEKNLASVTIMDNGDQQLSNLIIPLDELVNLPN
jgi:hypothetical protein